MPIIQNFRANTITKAFILNALAIAITAALSIELRRILNRKLTNTNDVTKTLIVFVFAFVIAIFTYTLLHVIFGYGGGMLSR